MSTSTQAAPTQGLPAHARPLGARIAAGAATPGGAVFVLASVLLVSIIVANPNFGEPSALIRFAGRTAPIAIAAMGQYYVIVSGEFDLSMGAVVATQVVIAGNLADESSGQVVPVLVLMLVVGTFIGLVNGLVTTLLRVPSFIVTLGMMLALLGLVRYLTGGAATGNPVDEFRDLGRGGFQDVPVVEVVPYPLLIVLVLAAIAFWSMRRPFGRSLMAAGDNPEAARLGGTSVWWIKTRAFIISSLSATVAGIILVGYAGVHPSVGQGYEFSAITAVVVGGVLLGGGRGWVLSAAAGAYALELLFVLLTVLHVSSTWRDSVQGLIIILAVAASARAWQVGRRVASVPGSSPPGERSELDPSTPPAPGTSPQPSPGTHQGEKR